MTDSEEAPKTEAGESEAGETGSGEITMVDGPSVDCDGGGGALGHPRVFLTFDSSGRIDCPYCGRKFVRQAGGAGGH